MAFVLMAIGIILMLLAIAIGAWRQSCVVYENRMSYNCPPLWKNPLARIISWTLTAAFSLAFSGLFAFLISKHINDYFGKFSFGGFLVLRWWASMFLGALPAHRKADKQFLKPENQVEESFERLISAVNERRTNEITEILFECGEAVHCYSNSGLNALHIVLTRGAQVSSEDVEIVEKLIRFGADVDAKSKDDLAQAPIHYVASQGEDTKGHHAEIAEILLANGADVDSRMANGWTPLHLIALNGSEQSLPVLDVLMKYKANPFATADDGLATWQFMWQHGESVRNALLNYEKSQY